MPAPTRSVRRPYPWVVARLSGLAGIGLFVSLVCALVITFSGTNPPESYAQEPPLPHQFVGTVKINGTIAPDGTVIAATIDNVEAATAIVDSNGVYQLKIRAAQGLPDPTGKTIKFTVGGQIANESQLFENGGGTELNLTVTLVPPEGEVKDWFPNWSPFLSQTPPSPGNGPKLSGVAPNTAYPRQLVSLKGQTAGTRVVWDVGSSRETDVSPVAPITKDYFQIPADASPGVHKVAIRNSSGTSNAVKVTVLAPSGDFPAPRIEDVGLRLQPSGKWILMLAAANLDADATVTVDSTQADSALISGLPISYMKDHIPDTFKYPVYHYSQLAIVAPDLPADATLTLMTTNADGKSDGFSYRLPADWKDVDSDGDGLLDRWEEGTYTAPSGTTIDLAAMGVHKHKKDILIEADWVKVAAPPEVVWTKLEEAFANAPVLNPDGTSGVNIIVDRGQGGAFLGGGDLLTPNHQSMSYSSRHSDYRSAWYPGPSTPAPAPNGTKIAFASDRDGASGEIYVMNSDGSDHTRLTDNTANDHFPSLSPNGARIAFESNRDGNDEIYVMNADGSNQTRLTDDVNEDSSPSWSPDGKKIAFASHRDGNFEIYIMNADGSNQTRLSSNSDDDQNPSWSPDGKKIAFDSKRDGSFEIYIMNADGSKQTRLTDNAGYDYDPSWSPDGTKIAFTSGSGGEDPEIYVMNSDGSKQTRLTDTVSQDSHPSWSPDGKKIAFNAERDGNGNFEIYVMNADGSNQTRITGNSTHDMHPSWGPAPAPVPTGAKIAFASTKNENTEIYVMNADGSGRTMLTDWQGVNTQPNWSFDGNKIVFTSDSGGTIENPGGDQEIYVMNAAGTDVLRITDNVGDDYRPKWSPDRTQIAFESQRDGNREIYVMNADGSGQTNLTNDPAWHGSPSWSPDGTKIAFTSDERVRTGIGNHDIYVMNADGSGQTRLTDNNEYDWSPAWSPDGTMIAFQRDHDIHVMNADGSGQTRLTDDPARDWQPSWSPDGTKITFRSGRDGNFEIYVMNADGSDQTRLTNDPEAVNDFPSWRPVAAPAPNGTKIAFASQENAWEQKLEIYVMNADGSGLTRLTDNLSNDLNPSWSADGTKIVFSSNRDGNGEIYVMNADGSNQTRLSNNVSLDYDPSLSPDGATIAFTSDRDGNYEIYVMNADGSNQTRLTDSAELDWFPSWSPDGAKIAFSSERDGNPEIYVMNADGSNQTRLTDDAAGDVSPSWSTDGTKIAFTSERDGNPEIYVMNADGSDQSRLTDDKENDGKPSWSPDGNGITFMSTRDSRPFRPIRAIYIMNADGSGQTRLMALRDSSDPSWGPAPAPAPAPAPTGAKIIFDHANSGGFDIGVMNADGTGEVVYLTKSGKDRLPAVSPDGKKIVFTSNRDGNNEIYIMNTDGTSPTRLTNSGASDEHPSWSPDGKKIAFQSSTKINVIDADGNNKKVLTSQTDYFPAWSPDGEKIAFASNVGGTWGIHAINADGTGRTVLTDKDDAFPAWSPDSSKLVFISMRDGNFGLYEMNADGSDQKRLMSDESDKWMPSYSPDGKKISFAKNIGEWLANGGGNYDIHTINADGTGLTRVTDNSIQEGYVTFATHKERHFNIDRLGIFKYFVLARQSPDALGIAEFPFGGPTQGDDFWVALATWSNDPSRIASVSMHELGHDLGLSHGGIWPNPNHNTSKPNFPSIMSYRYAADGISTDCNNTPDGLLTFSQGQLKDIVEPDTDESIGICDNKPLDMNNDGSITSGGIDSDGRSGVRGTHRDYDQWGNMVIDFMNR